MLKLIWVWLLLKKNEKKKISLNFDPVIKKVKNRFNIWLQRDFVMGWLWEIV